MRGMSHIREGSLYEANSNEILISARCRPRKPIDQCRHDEDNKASCYHLVSSSVEQHKNETNNSEEHSQSKDPSPRPHHICVEGPVFTTINLKVLAPPAFGDSDSPEKDSTPPSLS